MGERLHRVRFLHRFVAATLVACAVLAAYPAGAFSLSGLRNRMVDFLLEQISTPGSFEVQAERVEDTVDGQTSLVGVTISDGDGVWMTIDSVAFSWSPRRLLRREVEINSLTISRLSVMRAPTPLPEEAEAEPEEDSGGFSFDWPRSPIAMRVERVALQDIHVAEGVAPQEIRFDGTGGARDEGDIQALKLAIRRTDGVEGVIDLDYERNFDTDLLRLNLTAREAPGGMIAAVAGLDADANTRIDLKAEGPPEDWRVALNAAVDGLVEATGEAAVSYAGPLAAKADFTVIPGFKMGEAALIALSPAVEISVDAAEAEDGLIDIRAAEIASPALSVVADGTWSRPTGALDLVLTLAAERTLAALADGVDFSSVDFDGRAAGTPDDLTLSGDFGIAGLSTATADVASLTLNATVQKAGDRIAVTGSGLAEGMRLDQLQPETIGPAKLTLDAALEGEKARLTALTLESGLLAVSAEGGVDLAAESVDVRYSVEAPDLAPVAASYGTEAAGAFSATGAASGTLSAPRVDGELSLNDARVAGRDLGGLTVAHEIVLGDALDADVTAAFRGSEFGDADLVADAVLEGETLAASYRLTAPDLSQAGEALGTPLAGALTAEGEANGPTSALDLKGEARIEEAAAAGTGLGLVTLSHAVALGEAIAGDMRLALAASDYGDAEVATDFTLQGETLNVKALSAAALGLTVEGGAKVDLAATTVEGQIAAAGGLDGVGRFTGTPMTGSLNADLALSAPEGRQAARLNADLSGFQTEGAGVEAVSLLAEGRDLLGQPSVSADLTTTSLEAGDLAIETAQLTASGPLSAIQLAFEAIGEAGQHELSLASDAVINASGQTTRATISSLVATLAEERAELSAPLVITSGGGVTRLAGLDLSLPDDARLAGEAALYPNGASGDITLDGLTMASMRRLGLNVFDKGETDLSARFDTRSGPAFAEVLLEGKGLSREGALKQQGRSIDMAAEVNWDGRIANLEAGLKGPSRRPLSARATLPLRPTGGLAPAPPRGAEIDAAIDWGGRIEDIWSLIPATGHIIRGETDLAVTVTGPIETPRIGGSVKMVDGAYENLDLGTILTDLDVDTTIVEGRDIGLTLSASDGAGGRVEGQASIALSGPNEGLDVKVSTKSATLVRRDDVTARLHGDVAVTGPLNDLLVAGEIEIEGAEVRLVNSSPPGVASLGEVEIKGEEQKDRDVGDEGVVKLDMRIFSEGRIFVRGRGLQSEWRVDLNIDGSASDPNIAGSVERVRGTLDLIGREFVLERGAVTFTGPADPMIDVMLTRETDDFIGRIVVTGTGSEPMIAFTSDPVVPEEEVLPQALFGRSSQSLTAAEGLQLALGVATLMDGGDGAVGDIRGALGVDVLSLDTDDEGEQEVNVGSYVADGVYVGAKQSLGGSSAVVVEIDILDNVTVDVETGSTTGDSVGVNWRYDF